MKQTNIVFALNYSHLRLFKKVNEQYSGRIINPFFILYDLDIKKASEIIEIHDFKIIKPYTVNKKKILSTFSEVRSYTNYLDKNLLEPFLKLYTDKRHVKIYQFNEKNLAFQYFFYKIEKNNSNTSLEYIDEGFASYVNNYPKDILLKLIYPPLTSILWGWPFYFFRRGGTHHKTKTAFLRSIELLPEQKKSIQYFPFSVGKRIDSYDKSAKNTLLITSPLSEFGLISREIENKVVEGIILALKTKDLNLEIKQHPREASDKYNAYESKYVKIVRDSVLAEDINFSKYSWVINFGSSVILDLVSMGYPINKIVTIPKSQTSKDMELLKRTKMTVGMNDFLAHHLSDIISNT